MPKDYRHRCRRSIRLTYGINWPRVGEGSVTERRVPKGVPVAAHRAGMYANHARREAEHGAMMLDEVRVVPAHQRTDYRELVRVSAGREAENWVRAVVWLLRLLSPDGWQGPILERNALKRARVEVAVQKARKLTLRRLEVFVEHGCPVDWDGKDETKLLVWRDEQARRAHAARLLGRTIDEAPDSA